MVLFKNKRPYPEINLTMKRSRIRAQRNQNKTSASKHQAWPDWQKQQTGIKRKGYLTKKKLLALLPRHNFAHQHIQSQIFGSIDIYITLKLLVKTTISLKVIK